MQKLSGLQVEEELGKLGGGWRIDNDRLVSTIEEASFTDAITLINEIAELAETLDHHPDLRLHSYSKLEITIYTHKVGGLTKKDFDLAARIDELTN